MTAEGWAALVLLLIVIVMVVVEFAFTMSWACRRCGNRTSGLLHDFLNPFRPCLHTGTRFER